MSHQQDNPDDVRTTTADFLAFHRANPNVYTTLRRLAKDWLRAGKGHCSMTLLYNIVRWRESLLIEGNGLFELNDHYVPFYSRALMHYEPELRGMFALRRAPEADAWIRTQTPPRQVAA